MKIKNCLISVSDKERLLDVLKILKKYSISTISSGGTYNFIKKKGYSSTKIEKYTGFKEMLDGRVKTLHPKIHAGILHNRSKQHFKEMRGKQFPSIDLIIVNFYPFQQMVLKKKFKKIIDSIDIGGPTMVRAAAKNFKNVLIITSINDYKELIIELKKNNGATSLQFREKMASKAFALTAYYDAMISDWFNKKINVHFPERKIIFGRKLNELRYGENPHQKASVYISDFKDKEIDLDLISGKKLSYNNYNDIFSSIEILNSFKKLPTTVVVKHSNPCGISSNLSKLKSFINAFNCDPLSAFGGVVACNFKMNIYIAKEINKRFIEVIMAKGFDKKSLNILKKKKNLRIIDISKFKQKSDYDIKYFGKTFLLQEKNLKGFDKEKIRYVTSKKPRIKDFKELEFASIVCKHVKSNSIVITKNLTTLGIGAGQPSRVDSCKIAVQKAKKFHNRKINNSYAASDAFFPFPDGVKILASSGVKTIIQPGGSVRDGEILKLSEKMKIKMIFTGTRHFSH